MTWLGVLLQVNTAAAEVLYMVIQEWAQLDASSTVLDVCCGTGTIGLALAKVSLLPHLIKFQSPLKIEVVCLLPAPNPHQVPTTLLPAITPYSRDTPWSGVTWALVSFLASESEKSCGD